MTHLPDSLFGNFCPFGRNFPASVYVSLSQTFDNKGLTQCGKGNALDPVFAQQTQDLKYSYRGERYMPTKCPKCGKALTIKEAILNHCRYCKINILQREQRSVLRPAVSSGNYIKENFNSLVAAELKKL